MIPTGFRNKTTFYVFLMSHSCPGLYKFCGGEMIFHPYRREFDGNSSELETESYYEAVRLGIKTILVNNQVLWVADLFEARIDQGKAIELEGQW